jgi:hypothetical protein
MLLACPKDRIAGLKLLQLLLKLFDSFLASLQLLGQTLPLLLKGGYKNCAEVICFRIKDKFLENFEKTCDAENELRDISQRLFTKCIFLEIPTSTDISLKANVTETSYQHIQYS